MFHQRGNRKVEIEGPFREMLAGRVQVLARHGFASPVAAPRGGITGRSGRVRTHPVGGAEMPPPPVVRPGGRCRPAGAAIIL